MTIMNIKRYKNFCVFPFVHTVQNPYDSNNSSCTVLPCCRYDNSAPNTELKEYIDPINKSPIWESLQEQFLNDKRPPGCSHCWREEDEGRISYRQIGLEWYEDIIANNRFLDKKLRFLEIMLSNVCNLACRSCNSGFSSKWKPIDSYLFDNNFYMHSNRQISFPDWRKLDLSNLTQLKIMGGEPLYQKEIYELLEYLESINVLSSLRLTIPTNCTIFPDDRLIKLLNKSKHVMISLSIDAVGKLNDYIRSGSTWNIIEQNFHRYLELQRNNKSKYRVITNSVITCLNINQLDTIKNYFNQYNIESHYDFTTFPRHLYIGILPNHIKTFIKNKFVDDVSIAIFEKNGFDHKDFLKLRHYIKVVDGYHKNYFEEANPEMYSLIYNTHLND